jgi:hypothetical protein
MAEEIHVKMPSELRRIIEGVADDEGKNMGEVAVRLIAQALGRPELGYVPRKRMGRPRKEVAGRK